MSQRSLISDPFKFAAEGRALQGSIPVGELDRLGDILFERSGAVTYVVAGEIGPDRKARLRVRAAGVFKLRCQRCLDGLEWPLEIDSVLQLVRPGETIPEEELEIDEFDAIEAPPDLDVRALVEDEIVLAVPLAPRHEECNAPRPSGGVEKESPFAVLAKLRREDGAQ